MFLKSLGLTGMMICCVTTVMAVQSPNLESLSVNEKRITGLSDLVIQIQEDNPAVQAAQAALDAAQARVDGSGRPLYNPDLELATESTDVRTTTLGLSQTLDWSDKQGARHQIAQKELLVTKAVLAVVRRQVAVDVVSNLSRYQNAHALRKLAVRRTQLMKKFAETVEARQQAGDVSQLDLALARVAYTEARMQQGNIDATLVSAEAALRAVSGLVKNTWPELPEDLPVIPDSMNIGTILEQLPELVIPQQHVERARAQIRLANSERRPDPTIGVWGGREDEDSLIGLRLEVPLFVRNSFRAEAKAASQEALQMEQVYLEKRRRAQARLEGALASYRTVAGTWQDWRATGQMSLIEQVDLLEKLWEAGELNASDYLIQAKQNIDTLTTAGELAGKVWLAAIEWLDASGKVEPWLAEIMGDE